MRIALLIAKLMVPPVASRPEKDRALRGHAAGNAQASRDESRTFETPMRKQAVETHSDTETCDHVHDRARNDVGGVDEAAPTQDRRGDNRQERQDDGYQSDAPLYLLQLCF